MSDHTPNSITAEYARKAWRDFTELCLTCGKSKLTPGTVASAIDEIPKYDRCVCHLDTCPSCGGAGVIPKRPIGTLPSVNLIPGVIQSSDPPIDTDVDIYCHSCSIEARHDVFHSPPACPMR